MEVLRKTYEGITVSLKAVKHNRKLFIVTFIVTSIMFSMDLPTAIIYEKYFSKITDKGFDAAAAFGILKYLIIIAVIPTIIMIIMPILLSKLYLFGMYAMRENVLRQLFKNTPGSSELSMGETINSIKEDTQAIFNLVDQLMDIPGRLVFFIGTLYMVVKADRLIALILLIPLFAVLVITSVLSKKLKRHSKEAREKAAKVSSHLGDIVSNISAIKVTGSNSNMMKALIAMGEERRKAQVKTQVVREVMWDIGDVLVGVAMFLVLILSAEKLSLGLLTMGNLFIFTYFSKTAWIVQVIGRITASAQSAAVSYDRIGKMVGMENREDIFVKRDYRYDDEIKVSEHMDEAPLKIRNLTATFKGEHGVKDINMEVNPGEFLVITGRIGSGKSTLLKSLVGIKDRDGGEIYYGNEVLKDRDYLKPPLASFTPQIPNLFSDTIKNNILMGQPYDDKKMEECIKDSVLEEDFKGFTDGIDTLVGSKGVKLSGGQKQRVAVARMLYHNSNMFLLDDISSALDVDTESRLWNNLKNKTRTRIAISTRHIALRNADRILVIKNGYMDSMGTYEELMKKSHEFRDICETSAR